MLTAHAIIRYQERVENIPEAEVRARLSTTGIRAAIAFGVRVIRLGSGAQLVIENRTIVTVLAPDQRPKRYGRGYRYKLWRRKQSRKRWKETDDHA